MTNDLSKHLGENLFFLRKNKGLSQQLLSQMSEVPRPTIAQIEGGEGNPSLKTLYKIAQALQVRIDELISIRRPKVSLTKLNQLRVQSLKGGGIEVSKLLPDNTKNVEFEKLRVKPGFSKAGVPHLKNTKEYFHCLKGTMTIVVEGEAYNVEQGDVLAFDGDQRHSYFNRHAKDAAEGVSVVFFS